MTSPVPATPTSPPTEAVRAADAALYAHETMKRLNDDDLHVDHRVRCRCGEVFPDSAEWCTHRAAAVVAALDLPARDRETAAKALDDAASEAKDITCGYPNNPTIRSVKAIQNWLRARATALREGDNRG